MKQIYFLFILLISASSFAQVINEFEPNPVGTDAANVSFEIKGTPSAAFSGWVLSLESDPGNIGVVDRAASVSGTFDANGILVVSIPDLENPSFTVILTDTFTGAIGDDLDTDDDATLDTTPWTTVYDAIGIPDTAGDEANLYGAALGGADFSYTGDEPGLVFRDGTSGDWLAINDPAGTDAYDINANTVNFTLFNADPSISTFGSENPTTQTAGLEEENKISFSIYPNPVSNGMVTIKSNLNEILKATIYTVLGKKVLENNVVNNTLNVAALTSGIYLIKLEQNGLVATKKLVIN